MSSKYIELRRKHKKLIYHDFTVEESRISFHFSIDDFHFKPEWAFNTPLYGDIRLLAFNLGMAELISYWKCACPPVVEVRCGALDERQVQWWKKLYRNGLGEFFYRNGIEPDSDGDFMQIHASGQVLPCPETRELSGNFIPVGGGKDSVVTLELLREQTASNACYIVGNIQSALDCAKTAGYPDSQVVKVSRTIDPTLLELNRQGYLNGHTPFSSIVAFSSLLFAYLSGKKYIVLSNESSANEGNTNTGVNHQYSKSVEFERDFREYVSRLGSGLPEYFSLLRPWSEWQITKKFATFPQYLSVFKSCNAGSKTNTWCCNCAKCLYVYIMLSAFLDGEALNRVFGEDLLQKKELIPVLEALRNPDCDKPFECVGTREEINLALDKARANPTPLDSYFDENHFVPETFLRLLK